MDDILRVPSFVGKKKPRTKKTTPTMQYVLSVAKHREAITRKENEKEKEEKEELARKTEREENKRKRIERQEAVKLKKEIAKRA